MSDKPPFRSSSPSSGPGLKAWLALGGAAAVLVMAALLARNGGFLSGPREPEVIVTSGTVAAGETMARVLGNRGLAADQVRGTQNALASVFDLRRMRPGDNFEIETSTANVFRRLTYHTDPIHSFTVTRSSAGVYEAATAVQRTVWRERLIQGEITEFLYRDLMKLGFDETFVANLVADLADNIMGWRVDFFSEQRPGDRFGVLLEQEYIEGSDTPLWKGRGRIVAAYYEGKATRQKMNLAIRFTPQGEKRPEYYDEVGGAVRRAFLRAPFTHGAFRVSSGYNPRRMHPILRVYRPHHGTDYAAATGTPVAAIGKGTVITAGWKGGYGRCVEIRHNGTYVSRYGHLSSIAVRLGQSINQGQYIGRVGSSGLSTGPHLHFEMLVNGSQRNFLTMSFPAAASVAPKDKADFERVRDAVLPRLKGQPAAPAAS